VDWTPKVSDRIECTMIPAIQCSPALFRVAGPRVVYLSIGSELPDHSDLLPHMRAFAESDGNTRGNRSTRSSTRSSPARASGAEQDGMSASHSIGFERLLRAWGMEQLLFTGMSTNPCVESTARGAATAASAACGWGRLRRGRPGIARRHLRQLCAPDRRVASSTQALAELQVTPLGPR
jgi:hypothetical protein